MMRNAVGRLSSGAQLIAAMFLALAGLRFAVSAVLHAIATRAPRLPQLVASSSPTSGSVPVDAASGRVAGTGTVPKGESARPTLSVTAGSPRSEVFVNGVRRGKTPFIGEVSCKTGHPVRVEVVPAQGAPQTFVRECKPGNILIGN